MLWRVVSTDDITPHVWKSCDVLSVRMISLHTSKRVVTCYQYGWYHSTRLKELWRVISTGDITRRVWKSCSVLSERMLSHHTSGRVVTCYHYGWYHTTRLKELWRVVSISHDTSGRVVTCCQYGWYQETRTRSKRNENRSLRLLPPHRNCRWCRWTLGP